MVLGGSHLQSKIKDQNFKNLFKHNDHLSAITLVKRVWHLAYLCDRQNLKAGHSDLPIRSTHAIAARTDDLDDNENTDTAKGEKYIAAIAFDGDSIGKWVSGDYLPSTADLRLHHADFSKALSDFALGEVRRIVGHYDGFLIYAGGDDVVALVPADCALDCAGALRDAFQSATRHIKGSQKFANTGERKELHPDASTGIAIAHFKSPLQDLIRAAQAAEKDAKNQVGRPAFSITLMKRSGEISQWGANWHDQAVALYDAISTAMAAKHLASKFPHRICQLLEPYLTTNTGISHQLDVADFPIHEVIAKEFEHAATRQGSKDIAKDLLVFLDKYLAALGTDPQRNLNAIIGLCTTLAFAHRNRPESLTADRQTA